MFHIGSMLRLVRRLLRGGGEEPKEVAIGFVLASTDKIAEAMRTDLATPWLQKYHDRGNSRWWRICAGTVTVCQDP